jgi:hypothetical protein
MPKKLLNGFYIINLNGKSHWCALCNDGGDFYYFDSYGFPGRAEVEEQIGAYIHSDVQLQDMNSSACGFYCLAWMKWMENEKNKKSAYSNFLKLFTQDTRENEMVLHHLLN